MVRLIKIYGERNTNTNYLSELVRANLHVEELPGVVPAKIKRLQDRLPGKEWLRDLYFHYNYSEGLGWKHAAVDWDRLHNTPVFRRHKVTVITLTKNPYSWLLSLYRKPYHYYDAAKPDFSKFLRQPWKTVRREHTVRYLENPIQLWNIKNASYLNSCKEDSVIRLKSEDTLLAPENVINTIEKEIGDSDIRKDSFINITRSTKDKNKHFEYYKDYYLNERWRSDLSSGDIEFINNQLNVKLVEKFGYCLL